MRLSFWARLRQPQCQWPIVIGLIFATELVLGVLAYWTCDIVVAMIAFAGVPLLAIIDWFARRNFDGCRPTWYRRHLAAWCLVPFVCAVAGSTWVHYQKRRESLEDIRAVAADVRQAIAIDLPAKTWGVGTLAVRGDELVWGGCQADPSARLTAEDVDETIGRLIARRHALNNASRVPGEAAVKSEETRRFGELARVAGRDLRIACGHQTLVHDRVERDTIQGFALTISLQALFVLWIPVLLAVTIARAARRDRRAAPPGVCESLHGRDDRILAEDQFLFLPRFCFGALLVLGTNYVFAPFGLKATYVMAIVDEHALPGHTSWALWSTSFAEVPVLVVGFVGFLLYALITATQRFSLDDLDDRAVLSLLVRGLVVILLAFALSSSPINDVVERIFVFVAGVFPLRALEALAKKVNVAIDPDFDSAVSSFAGLPSLDPVKVFALRSAGIQSTYDLAATPIEEIAERVRIDPRLLGRAVDRAILIEAIGLELARRLERFAIGSATELVALKDKMPELIEPAPTATDTPEGAEDPRTSSTQLRDAAARVAERLATDQRVARLRAWLAGSPHFDGIYLGSVMTRPLPTTSLPVADARVAPTGGRGDAT